MKVLSQLEQSELIRLTADKLGTRNGLIIQFFLFTGVRVSELIALTFEDVYYQTKPKRIITLRAETCKRAKSRDIPVSEKLQDVLSKYYAQRAEDLQVLGINTSLPLFCQTRVTDKRLTARQIQRIVRLAGQLINRPDLHPHLLRHTFATGLMRVTDIRTVQTILGHSSLQSTQIYTHPDSNDMAQAVNNM